MMFTLYSDTIKGYIKLGEREREREGAREFKTMFTD